jgi:TRAP-type C4-dicarboxylate transport system substrate-binding protein
MRISIHKLVAAIALAGAFTASTPAMAQNTVLKYSNWLPPGQAMRVEVVEPWIAEVEKATKGRVKIDTAPKVVGTVPAQFDVARDGQADLVIFIPGYTPNRFDLLEVLQLPFVSDNPEVLAPLADRFYRKHLASYNEFKGVHPLSVYVVSPGQVFNSKRPLRSVADFKGLKMRSPQTSATQALTLLGAVPISKPVSETYELLSSGVIDGTFMPPESIPAFKLTELVPYATIVPGAIYNTVLVLGINEEKWKSLRAEDREAITRISGDVFARNIGGAYAKGDKGAFDIMRKAGKPAEVFPAPALVELKKVLLPIETDWMAKAKKKGMADPQKTLDQLRADIASAK